MRKILSFVAAFLFAAGMMADPVVLPAVLDVSNVSFRSEGMPNFVIEEGQEYAGTYFDMGAHDSANDTLLYAEWDVTIEPIKYNLAVDVYNTNSWRVQLYLLNQAGDTVKSLRYKGSSGQKGQFSIGSLDLSDLTAGNYKVRAHAATAWSAMKLKDVIFAADYQGVSVNLPGTLLPAYAELSAGASVANNAIAFAPATANTEYAIWNVSFAEAGNYNVSIDMTASNGHTYGVALLSEDGTTEVDAVAEAQAWDTGVKELGAIEVPAAGNYQVKLTNATQWSEAVINSITIAAPIGAPAYYLVGSMNNWTPADEYKFEENPGAPGEYMLTAALTVGDEIKVKGIVGATETWYPAGTGNNYVVDADHAGEWKKIYFRPEGQGGEDWHYGFFFVEENPAPVVEFDTIYTWYGKRGESTATEAIEKGGVATAEGGNSNIVVGTAQKTNWTIKLNKGFSNANYVGITLNEALKAGDQMQLAAFIASDNTAVLGIDFSESKEAASTDCQLLFSDLQLISTNAAPEDTLFTIPAAAAGAKYIRVYRNSGQTGVYIANITILRNGDTPEPPAPEPKFCVTGDSALVVDAGAEASKAWAADAVPSMTDTLVLNLKANQYYVLKLVDGANWLGYHDLSEVAPGLVEDSPEEYHNIGFTLAEAGEVKVIYTEGVPNKIFKLEGNFYVEPVAGCDWDNIDFLADASIEQAFANQFKVCKDGAEPNVANVQSPDWADTTGIYVNFPDAVIGEISLPEGQYKQQGAGILLYVTAFTLKETEFTIQWQDGIYTLTVLNVNGEEPEPEHTYTVVGDELVFGSNWNPEDVANDMAKQEDGSYKWTADSIVLIANTYAYKIVKDHSWAGEWPVGQGNNKTFAIAETGYYDVTITFNPEAAEAEKAVVEAVKVGDAVVLPTVAMHGDFTGSWKDTELFTNAADSSCASLKLNLEAKTYEFGMRIGSASNWTANSANLTRENPSTVLSVGASGNMHIVADQAGEYTFTYFYDADSLVVTYPKLYMHYGVAEAIAAAADSVLVKDDLVYIRGIVTKIEFKGKNFAKYGSACIYVADAAGAADTLEFYNCYSMNADTFKTSDPAYDATSTAWAQFNSVSDANGNTVALGDVVEAFGKYNLYNGVHQLNQGCYITEIHTPSVAPTTAPAAPTQAEEDVMAIYCDYYKTNNLHFGISGWAGAYETLNIEDTKIAYWKAMTWECVIDPVNTDSIHDLSGYKKLHVDFWAPAAAKIKFTAEAVAGGNYKDGVVLDLAEGWTSWDIEIATWPGLYDFANLKCLVLEQYQTPEGASFEGNPFAVANIYFYEKKAEGFENIDASVKAVKVLQNGQIFILRGDKVYTVTGQPIEK